MEITYNKEYLDLVKSLSSINPAIIFEKVENNRILVKRNNASSSIIYTLEASDTNFNFSSEDLAFYNYPEFHQLLSVFDDPTLTESENKIKIEENKSKIHYKVSDSEVIQKVNGTGKVPPPNAIITISSDQLDEIKKMIGLVSAEKVKFKVTEGSKELTCKFFNLSHSNNWENEYEVDKESDIDFELTISSQVFSLIPKNSYEIRINEAGVIKMHYINDEFDLNLYIPEDTEA